MKYESEQNLCQFDWGTTYSKPQDHGWMYQHAFADLDGHQWELAWMDESQIPQE